jgi:hypothetical protein
MPEAAQSEWREGMRATVKAVQRQNLDGAEIDTGFEKMCSEGMP